MDFVPNTREDVQAMLDETGIASVSDLFTDVPEACRMKTAPALPGGMSERELAAELDAISGDNHMTASFLGGGCYNHYVPSTVKAIISRGEFYTAYTPYQPEISQGTLQALFEYQSMICDLTGMEVSNASLYDGATALADAMLMAVRIKGVKRVVVSRTVNPLYRRVLETYARANSVELVEAGAVEGAADISDLEQKASGSAAVLVQCPNYFGIIEDLEKIRKAVSGCMLITSTSDPTAWGLLRPFAEFGADIVTAEGQSFGNGMNYGGPNLGIMAARKAHVRQMPGRLVGRTVDTEGRWGFILTLSTREQHIRREKATSNICSNEGLCALAASVYLATVGANLLPLARLNHRMALHFRNRLASAGVEMVHRAPFYNEFVIRLAESKYHALKERGIDIGIPLSSDYPELSGCFLVCCTEMNTKSQMDAAMEVLR
ncbi:MAG: aminomethyl-transferring glycine dehydrogenase subunit GcvPA [Candidatus Latescibacterota bacterium]